MNCLKAYPNVHVLLATHNGLRWLPLQLESILSQQCVNVVVWASDDASSDGTWEWLQEQGKRDPRIKILPKAGPFGCAAKNFFRLIREAGWEEADYVAFADQDDIWMPDKLHSHSKLIKERDLMAVSSNVMAFWPNGRAVLIDKSQAQTEWDFLFESAGPGCTYLMRPALVAELKLVLEDEYSNASQCALHDWLAYAVCRSKGWGWHIDSASSVCYRQHGGNEFGANAGIAPAIRRLAKAWSGWHRKEVGYILDTVIRLTENKEKREGLQQMRAAIDAGGGGRLKILKYAIRGRRKLVERLVLLVLIVAFVW